MKKGETTLTVSFAVRVVAAESIFATPSQIQEAVENQLSYYSDGRYNLFREMVEHALTEVTQKAVAVAEWRAVADRLGTGQNLPRVAETRAREVTWVALSQDVTVERQPDDLP